MFVSKTEKATWKSSSPGGLGLNLVILVLPLATLLIFP